MIHEFDRNEDWGIILKEVKRRLNGEAPNGFKYIGEIRGDKIVIKTTICDE